MNPSRIALALALLLLPGSLAAAGMAEPPKAAESPAPNAALRYWRAMHTLTGETGAALQDKYDGAQTVIDADTRKLLGERVHEVNLLLGAAAIDHCDFEWDHEAGFMATLPHLTPLRNASRLLALDAIVKCDDGKPDEAAERLAAIFCIARHTTTDRLLISSLVGVAIAEVGRTNVERLNSRLTREGRARIIAAIDKFNAADPFACRAAVQTEGEVMLAFVRKLADSPDAAEQLIEMGVVAGQEEQAKELAQMSSAQIKASCDQAAKFYDDALAAWDQPDAPARLDELGTRAGDGAYGLVAKLMCPAMGKVRASNTKAVAGLAAARAMLLGQPVPAPVGAAK